MTENDSSAALAPATLLSYSRFRRRRKGHIMIVPAFQPRLSANMGCIAIMLRIPFLFIFALLTALLIGGNADSVSVQCTFNFTFRTAGWNSTVRIYEVICPDVCIAILLSRIVVVNINIPLPNMQTVWIFG